LPAAGSPIRRPFPPERRETAIGEVNAKLTHRRALNPPPRPRSYPRVVKRARHNSYKIKKPGDVGIRHDGPPGIDLPNLPKPPAEPAPTIPAILDLAA
jgi:hypothetical protein